MSEDAKFLKRKIRGGSIDVHPTEKAIVVHYETEATILGELGNPVIGDRKQCQKIIRVKNLNENTDIQELARKIVDNCKLILQSKLPQVEHLLKYLLKRKEVNETNARIPALYEKLADPGAFDSTEIEETAHLTDVDEYLELLYEDIPEKLRSSALILQLARNPDNLEEVFQNETLVGALARVLREDWKKSNDLATNIIYVFFCFSAFTNFHSVILHFKIGALTMNILEHELQKYDQWSEELVRKRAQLTTKLEANGERMSEHSQESLEVTLMKFNSLVRKQEQLFRVSFYLLLNVSEDLSVEMKMHNKGIVSLICRCLERENYELLILLVSFLKKLSIFSENKEEMLKNRVTDKLLKILGRKEAEIINMTLRLLFNLSFDSKARKDMVSKGIIQKLMIFLSDEIHRPVTLYLLYNLSTEDQSKRMFAQPNCISTLIRMLMEHQDKPKELITMALLINLACDPECAIIIGDSKIFRVLTKQGIRQQDTMIMKLIRNLTMVDHSMKMKLVEFLPSLVKVVSSWEFKLRSGEDVDFCRANNEDYVDEDHELECLACLANLNLTDVDFTRVLNELHLLDWIQKCLTNLCNCIDVSSSPMNSFIHKYQKSHTIDSSTVATLNESSWNISSMQPGDDVVLELVRLIGTICIDPSAAQVVAEARIVDKLITLLNLKQEDDEIVCQIIHVFYQLAFHHTTRDYLVRNTQAPAYLIDLIHDKNNEIRRVCEISLDIISEHDASWGNKVLNERFRWHNSQWLQMVEPSLADVGVRNGPSSDAVAIGWNRAQHHQQDYTHTVIPSSSSSRDLFGNHVEGYDDICAHSDDEENTGDGGISDAATFLMSLRTGHFGYNSAESERQTAYLNRLEILYPEFYAGTNCSDDDGFIPACGDASRFSSDSDLTPQRCNSP